MIKKQKKPHEGMLIFPTIDFSDKHRIQKPAGGSSVFPDLRKEQGKGNSCQSSKLFKVVFHWPWQKYVQKGRYPYFLRVTQSSKKIKEKLNHPIPMLHRSEVTGLALRRLEYQIGSNSVAGGEFLHLKKFATIVSKNLPCPKGTHGKATRG